MHRQLAFLLLRILDFFVLQSIERKTIQIGRRQLHMWKLDLLVKIGARPHSPSRSSIYWRNRPVLPICKHKKTELPITHLPALSNPASLLSHPDVPCLYRLKFSSLPGSPSRRHIDSSLESNEKLQKVKVFVFFPYLSHAIQARS